jgi:protein-S-isoprenylcysteine O-methyltransferase Ste14
MSTSIQKLGLWLFRHRSYSPLPMIVLVLACFPPRHYGGAQHWVTAAAVATALLGEAVRVLTVGFAHHGTSGRESYLRADALNVTGAYSLVRNPLYIGNTLIYSGILFFWGNVWAFLLMLVFLCVQYTLIILGEESYLRLKYGNQYREYARTVPRILPCKRKFRSPESDFQWRRVIVKENDSVFNMLAMLLILQALREYHLLGEVSHDTELVCVGALLLMLYAGIKIWKKRCARQGSRYS